jgi:hypothetical protein
MSIVLKKIDVGQKLVGEKRPQQEKEKGGGTPTLYTRFTQALLLYLMTEPKLGHKNCP